MLAYSTTNSPEDGLGLANPERTWPTWLLDVTFNGLKGKTLLRRSKRRPQAKWATSLRDSTGLAHLHGCSSSNMPACPSFSHP